MTSIDFHVVEIRQQRIDTTGFDGVPRSLPGETDVTMSDGDESITLRWTLRGDLPAVGSRWTLTDVDPAIHDDKDAAR